MGAWGAIIMGFFGAAFAAMTLYRQLGWSDAILALPFLVFAAIAVAAALVIRRPGEGVKPSAKAERVIMWSTIGEGVGLFLAANIVINLHREALLLPAMAAVVGLHFIPIGFATALRAFHLLGLALLGAAVAGFVLSAPLGGEVAGFAAAGALWVAATMAVRRDWAAKASGS